MITFFSMLQNLKELKESKNKPPVQQDKWLQIIYELKIPVIFHEHYGVWISTMRGLCVEFNNHASVYSSFEYVHFDEIISFRNSIYQKTSIFLLSDTGKMITGVLSIVTQEICHASIILMSAI